MKKLRLVSALLVIALLIGVTGTSEATRYLPQALPDPLEVTITERAVFDAECAAVVI